MKNKYKNDMNPVVSASTKVSMLELKPGYWVTNYLKAGYDVKESKHTKFAQVEILVDEDTEEFIIKTNKNVKVVYWEDLEKANTEGIE